MAENLGVNKRLTERPGIKKGLGRPQNELEIRKRSDGL